MPPDLTTAKALNERCACITLDRAMLKKELMREFDAAVAPAALNPETQTPSNKAALLRLAIDKARPNLFSDTTVFVSAADLRLIDSFIAAHQRIAALPAWIAAALSDALDVAKHASAAQGVLMGYDFHLSASGPQLIEINTNAGGALLNMSLARAQRACCGAQDSAHSQAADSDQMMAMFYAEWRACRGDARLRHIAIVDDSPLEQYLLPEFLLFQQLFERAGIHASICDPQALSIANGSLQFDGEPVDMIYNRSTDFALASPASANLRAA